jgi:hypothetical protein
LKGAVASCKESTLCSTAAAVGSSIVGGIALKAVARAASAVETAGATGQLTGFTRHGLNRVIERGVKPADILNAVKNGEGIPKVDALGRTAYKYVGENATVILNNAGKVISAYNRGW